MAKLMNWLLDDPATTYALLTRVEDGAASSSGCAQETAGGRLSKWNASESSKNDPDVKRPAGVGPNKPRFRRNSWAAGKQSQTDGIKAPQPGKFASDEPIPRTATVEVDKTSSEPASSTQQRSGSSEASSGSLAKEISRSQPCGSAEALSGSSLKEGDRKQPSDTSEALDRSSTKKSDRRRKSMGSICTEQKSDLLTDCIPGSPKTWDPDDPPSPVTIKRTGNPRRKSLGQLQLLQSRNIEESQNNKGSGVANALPPPLEPIEQRHTFNVSEDVPFKKQKSDAGPTRPAFNVDEHECKRNLKLEPLEAAPKVKSVRRNSCGNSALDRLMVWEAKQKAFSASSSIESGASPSPGRPINSFDTSDMCNGSCFSGTPSESAGTSFDCPSFEVMSPGRQRLEPLAPSKNLVSPLMQGEMANQTFGKDAPKQTGSPDASFFASSPTLQKNESDGHGNSSPMSAGDTPTQPGASDIPGISQAGDEEMSSHGSFNGAASEDELESKGAFQSAGEDMEDGKCKNAENEKEEQELAMLIGDVEALEKSGWNGEDTIKILDEKRAALHKLKEKGVRPSPGLLFFRQVDWKRSGLAAKNELLQLAEALTCPQQALVHLEKVLDLCNGSSISIEQWLAAVRDLPELIEIIASVMSKDTGRVLSLSEQMAELIGDVAHLEAKNWRGEEGVGRTLLQKKEALKRLKDSNVKPSPGVLAFMQMDWSHSKTVETAEVKQMLASLSNLYSEQSKMVTFESIMPEVDKVEGIMELSEWLLILRNHPVLQEALEQAVDDLNICRVWTYRSPPERIAELMSEIKRLEWARDKEHVLQEKKDVVCKLEEKGVRPSHGVLLFQCLDDQGSGIVNRKSLQQILKQFSNNVCGPALHGRMLKKLVDPLKDCIDMHEWLSKLDSLPGLKYTIETNVSGDQNVVEAMV